MPTDKTRLYRFTHIMVRLNYIQSTRGQGNTEDQRFSRFTIFETMCVSYGLGCYTLLYYNRPYETEFIGGMLGVSSLLPLSLDIVYFTLLGLNKLKMFSTEVND